MPNGIAFERGPRDDSGKEKVVWQVREFKGRKFVDARLWFRGEDGKPHPTQKGTTIRARELDEVIRWLTAVRDELRAEDPGEVASTMAEEDIF